MGEILNGNTIKSIECLGIYRFCTTNTLKTTRMFRQPGNSVSIYLLGYLFCCSRKIQSLHALYSNCHRIHIRNKSGKGAIYMSYTELKNQVHSLVLICILFQVDFSKIKIFSNNNFQYNETKSKL